MSCVSIFSIKCLTFWIAVALSFIVIAFCITKLFIVPECYASVYIGLLGSIIGLWFPNPKLPKFEVIDTSV